MRPLKQGVEPTWTRTVNPNELFHFGEPKPNLNQQNFTSVNLNQTWTFKIVLKWTQTEPEPLTKVRIYFSISDAAGAGTRRFSGASQCPLSGSYCRS